MPVVLVFLVLMCLEMATSCANKAPKMEDPQFSCEQLCGKDHVEIDDPYCLCVDPD